MAVNRRSGWLAAATMVAALAMPVMVFAQDQGGQGQGQGQGNNGGGGGFGRRGNFDPAQFRQQMMDDIKTQLGATDDEFKALQPKIEKVFDDTRQLRAAQAMGFGGGRGGRRVRGFG